MNKATPSPRWTRSVTLRWTWNTTNPAEPSFRWAWLRQAMSFDELSFGSFSSGASRVASVGEDYVVSQFEREFWVKHGHEAEPETIRGMSGGPVFAIRHNAASGIITYEFIGHIYEFSEDFELLYVRLVRTLTL